MQPFRAVVQGGFFLMKKPLSFVASGYSNCETAVAQKQSSQQKQTTPKTKSH
jgi:hypothetical protein